ncbi:MAG: hypothetical protein U9N42_09300 [Campylobacterota bacterium]|nr:hypothetical protein [Campylobacterota bacterium]
MKYISIAVVALLLTTGCSKSEFKNNMHNINEGNKKNWNKVKDGTKETWDEVKDGSEKTWSDTKKSISDATKDYAND